ncbi:MAG TPA: Mut7-C RNAse domain-containing protein [Streptosporangiaceae bacterium]|nr:Mut7-C RNAse domain-containing protein [Streptosporangiaceae bacterium]
MGEPGICLRFDEDLRFFLAPRRRRPAVMVPGDGTSTAGHLVESLGVPLTEVGALEAGGRPVPASYRPENGDVVDVRTITRPQRLPLETLSFVLDVHLGTLARRLRLLGLDCAYANDADDDELIAQANAQDRVLLTRDRGLLRRRRLRFGGYVRGARPDEQLRDVLERFAPPLAPWTRCTACNGVLATAEKADVEQDLQPGTRRTYQEFARCADCGQVYWRGAHRRRLERVVAAATAAVTPGRGPGQADAGPGT